MSRHSKKVSDIDREPPITGGSFSVNVFGLMMDTGWRIAVPILGLMILAIVVDRALDTKPVFILLSIPLGMASSCWLVYKQLQAVNQATRNKGHKS